MYRGFQAILAVSDYHSGFIWRSFPAQLNVTIGYLPLSFRGFDDERSKTFGYLKKSFSARSLITDRMPSAWNELELASG